MLSLPVSVLNLHIFNCWLLLFLILQLLLNLCCGNWKIFVVTMSKSFLTPLFSQHLDTCHELFCTSLCYHLLTPFCLVSGTLTQKWLSLPHPTQLFLYTGHLCGLCIVPQYLTLLHGVFLFLFWVFLGCFQGSFCLNPFSPALYWFTSHFIGLF